MKKTYKKRLDFQQKIISRQSEKIEDLEVQNRRLQIEIEEKNEMINSIESIKKEMLEDAKAVKNGRKKYEKMIQELTMMKRILNQEVYKNRWWLIKFLIK